VSFADQKGNAIVYIIIAITGIAALAVGAFYMNSSAALGQLGTSNLNKAYFLALAGKEYALINHVGGDFTLSNGDKFHIGITGNTIVSTGIVNQGSPFETRRSITITKSGFSGGSPPDIAFASDIQSFASPIQSQAGFIKTDTNAASITLGNSKSGSFGSVWYGGSAAQGNCQNGKCDFGKGFRAYFVFQFASGSTGDGFTFAFFNGDGVDVHGIKNDRNSVGGDSSRGELLGYAGDSRVDSAGTNFLDGKGGRGIQPPKMAVEFDVYPNFGSSDVCASGSRRDGIDSRNHVAYVFWGDNTNSSCTSTVGRNTYDDNRHNAGGLSPINTDPINSRRPTDGADTSYFDASSLWPSNTNWLLSNAPTNIYAFRIEVTRGTTPNVNGNYEYTIKSWVKQCLVVNDITCPTYDDGSNFANTSTNYTDTIPTLVRNTVDELSPTLHQDFNSFYFGWTAATGAATQNVTLNRFRMNFLK